VETCAPGLDRACTKASTRPRAAIRLRVRIAAGDTDAGQWPIADRGNFIGARRADGRRLGKGSTQGMTTASDGLRGAAHTEVQAGSRKEATSRSLGRMLPSSWTSWRGGSVADQVRMRTKSPSA
jgi:hypothetical protein